MHKRLRSIIGGLLLVLAIAWGLHYLLSHGQLLKQLLHTPWHISIEILGLYIVLFGALVLILSATLRICQIKLSHRENALLNANSLLINFFIPGQGGPAYRGVYLNRKHRLRIKNYIVVTLLYYVIFSIVSVLLLLGGSRPWWQTIPLVAITALSGFLALRLYTKRFAINTGMLHLTTRTIAYLCLATIFQTFVQGMIYAVELHSVMHNISLPQIITYTGTANLALFVSLTPGAIGIRETFLIFTEHLHHITSSTIILANVIDRSVYITFLLLLIIVTFGIHAHNKLVDTTSLEVDRKSLNE